MVGTAGLTPVVDPKGALMLLWLIPALPLAGAGINLFAGKRLGNAAGWVGSLDSRWEPTFASTP